MPIKYSISENNITTDPDDYAAVVQISGGADCGDLPQDIIDLGSTVSKPDTLAVAIKARQASGRAGPTCATYPARVRRERFYARSCGGVYAPSVCCGILAAD